ncbi:hypothetical protein FCK90_07935 [Kocuria coralli]|uniref:RidA family protein n=1 Tax=Kocuria coralli TaxID=1461025 RepID=A0A5J5KXK3_9MICC|nr:Rid family hydrolase [Kocuria coralli]KAA9394384.1 hypothetical protein FCK90_07935 [Kocuria coralli]
MNHTTTFLSRRGTAAIAIAGVIVLAASGCANSDGDSADAAETSASAESTTSSGAAFDSQVDDSNDEALLADSVVIPSDTALFKTAGIGPSALNEDAPEGDPMSFVDPELLVDGELPDGMTVTEAQGLQVIGKLRELLQAQGLDVQDVATMRVFLQGEDGEEPDFAGWNRAYQQYFANTSMASGEALQIERGTSGVTTEPTVVNPTRPTRFALGIAYLPVDGWLVEVEVDAVYDEE